MILDRLRLPAVVAVCGLALLLTGCGSNNKGKIEGKWKAVNSTNAKIQGELAPMAQLGAYIYMEFKPGGAVEMGLGADKPEMLALLKASGKPLSGTGTHTLGSGDEVTMSKLSGMGDGMSKGGKAKI